MATNDNTLKTLGFIYQSYIALIKCLEMDKGDKVIIENLGDVSLISAKGISEQIEVKHHFGTTSISDRSDEIWNTVWNWYNNYDECKDIQKLILYTTANLSNKNTFNNWNNRKIDEKYELFKKVGEEFKGEEGSFTKIYNKIFDSNHSKSNLKSVLKRFEIKPKQETIKTILDKYEKNIFKFLGDRDRMDEFVSAIIGILMTLPIKSNCWEITYEEFDSIFKKFANRFTGTSSIPLPTEFEDYEITTVENNELTGKKFIDEINRIELSSELAEAITNYSRTYKTIIRYFDSNIVKSKDLKEYKKDLGKTLNNKRNKYRIISKKDPESVINNSQIMYYESMEMELQNIKGICNNRVFFQQGMMHIIVDDGELKWHVGDE
ncbi:hypothetical protein I6U48_00920 [Clostridium sp. PL3]|uniref:ABC-three component systems C-terminal domain-containing protein n=1 Tax=Clostridium thailandense TaxID=2794346 RepID=A0A949TLH5_9CLOT|nr:ABC-three component system protein [Clostridium thailandense]MBV7271482.1 hypothetical protein [Clostridium thailandense]